jgi:hypothetical protein
MFAWYLQNSLLASIALVTLLAWFKGGVPERVGASMNLIMALCFVGLQLTMQGPSLEIGMLTMDGLLGLGFLVLAVRYTSLWLGAAMLLQAAQFSLHAFYYVTHKPTDRLFAVVNNVVSWGTLLSIIVGTLATWFLASRAKAKAAKS